MHATYPPPESAVERATRALHEEGDAWAAFERLAAEGDQQAARCIPLPGDSIEQQIETMAEALGTTTPVQVQSYDETEEIEQRQHARRDAYQAEVDAMRAASTLAPTSRPAGTRRRGTGRRPNGHAARSSSRSGDGGSDDDGPSPRAPWRIWRSPHELTGNNAITMGRRLSWASTHDEIEPLNVEERLRGVWS